MPFTEDVKGGFKLVLYSFYSCVPYLRTSILATLHSPPAKDTQLRYFKNNFCKLIFFQFCHCKSKDKSFC